VTDQPIPGTESLAPSRGQALATRDRELLAKYPVERYLARSGGRLACPHPAHRFAQVPNSPARIILPECGGQDAWLAARGGGIGGSEVGALVIKDHPYETPFSVFNTKMNGGKDLSGEAAVEWGHRLEDVVAEKCAEEIGLASRFAGGLWANMADPILRVTPDRFACKARSWRAIGVIECKTAGDDDDWTSGSITATGQGTGLAPLHYQAQIQWQMGILGLTKGWLGCFVLGRERDYYVVEVDFNRPWFEELAAEARRFWAESILPDEPPMVNLRHPKTEALLKEIHPNVVRPSVDLDVDEAEFWLKDYVDAKAKLDAAEADVASIKNYFRMMVSDAGAGYVGDRKIVSNPEVGSTRIDVGALKEKYPEIAAELTVKGHHRRLTINPKAKADPKRLR
jgi:predicted phage-related endonuclease